MLFASAAPTLLGLLFPQKQRSSGGGDDGTKSHCSCTSTVSASSSVANSAVVSTTTGESRTRTITSSNTGSAAATTTTTKPGGPVVSSSMPPPLSLCSSTTTAHGHIPSAWVSQLQLEEMTREQLISQLTHSPSQCHEAQRALTVERLKAFYGAHDEDSVKKFFVSHIQADEDSAWFTRISERDVMQTRALCRVGGVEQRYVWQSQISVAFEHYHDIPIYLRLYIEGSHNESVLLHIASIPPSPTPDRKRWVAHYKVNLDTIGQLNGAVLLSHSLARVQEFRYVLVYTAFVQYRDREGDGTIKWHGMNECFRGRYTTKRSPVSTRSFMDDLGSRLLDFDFTIGHLHYRYADFVIPSDQTHTMLKVYVPVIETIAGLGMTARMYVEGARECIHIPVKGAQGDTRMVDMRDWNHVQSLQKALPPLTSTQALLPLSLLWQEHHNHALMRMVSSVLFHRSALGASARRAPVRAVLMLPWHDAQGRTHTACHKVTIDTDLTRLCFNSCLDAVPVSTNVFNVAQQLPNLREKASEEDAVAVAQADEREERLVIGEQYEDDAAKLRYPHTFVNVAPLRRYYSFFAEANKKFTLTK